MSKQTPGPHQEQQVHMHGALLENATAAMVMIHGRGGRADDILVMSNHFEQPDFAYLAPQAAGYTWYPNRFIAPIQANEPHLSSALHAVDDVVKQIEKGGIPAEKIMLLGFSQGACLALDYAARNARRYGGVVALSGGLIGDTLDRTRYGESMHGTPVFLGCSDKDFHIPLDRVKESTSMLREMGAEVEERIYPGMGHTIIQDEIDYTRKLMGGLL